ncbi:MAG TPA: ABC transporter permease [Thermoanaerobaculia bacterium]|nr:ABC transporter permease [Thermoanaerobaculia bacterium]
MESLIQDLRYAIRMLGRKPTFTLAAVISLGLGIGANTTIFSLVNALLLRPVPVEDPDRLVMLFTKDSRNPGAPPLSHLNWKDYRDQNEVFSGMAGYDWTGMSVATANGEPAVATGQLVSGNYFDLLGIRAALGQTFRPEEDATPGAYPVTVLSHRFWQERLGGDPGAVGGTIRINGAPYTVIGVAPASFTGVDRGVRPELWVPMAMNRQIRPDKESNWYETRRGLFVFGVARLKPGVTLEQARQNLTAIGQRLQTEFPTDNKGRNVELVPLPLATINPQVRQGVIAASALLSAVVALVLLIACANVANLLLARAAARRREVAIRLSQGASRARLIRQLLTESLLLATLGGVLGLLILVWARQAFLHLLPSLPFPVAVDLDLAIDARVLVFTLGLSLLTGFLFGLVPALQSSKPDLVTALKNQASLQGENRRGLGLRGLLVASQVALSLVSLIAAGLFLRSLGEAKRMDPGFDSQRLAFVSFDVGLQGMDQPHGEQFFRDVRDRIAALPGVAAATLAQAGPLQGSFSRSVFLEGRESESEGRLVQVNAVQPSYFATAGIPVLQGRAFDGRDRAGAVPVVIVNQTMAKRFWPGENPIGQRFHFFGQDPVEVIGVARDADYNAIGEERQPYVYRPLDQAYRTGASLIVRSEGSDPAPVLAAVQRAVRQMAPEMPLVGVETVAQRLDNSLWAPRLGASLLALFGVLALILAAVGIYGVMSYSVDQRSREIGVRMALGAQQGDVLGLILRQGMRLVAIGGVVGLALAFASSRLTANLLYGITPTDPVAFGATTAILALVSFTSIFVPARRATGVDPIVVLRYD